MVGLIIETPLAKNNIGARIFNSGDHVGEVVLLHLLELFVVLDRLDLNTVLGLGLWWFEGAGENDNLGVLDFLLHLGVREIFVNNNTFNELGVFNSTSRLGDDLDKVKVNVTAFNVSNVKHGSDGEIGEVILALADNLGSEGSSCAFTEEFVVVFADIKFFSDFVHTFHGDLASNFETIGNLKWVDTLVKKLLGLFKDSTGKNDDTSGTISDFVILGGRKFSQKFGGLMVDFHLFEDSGTVISDNNITIGGNEHLVHSLGTERGLQETGNSAGCHDVNLKIWLAT